MTRNRWIALFIVLGVVGLCSCSFAGFLLYRSGVVSTTFARVFPARVQYVDRATGQTVDPAGVNDWDTILPEMPDQAGANTQESVTSSGCRISAADVEQMRRDARAQAANNYEAVSVLIVNLDRVWENLSRTNSMCGFWRDLPESVPGSAVLWTNFHDQSHTVPVSVVLVDGDYGTFSSSGSFGVPSLNSGGRWLYLDGTISPEVSSGNTTGCLTPAGVDEILSSSNAEVAFDTYYQDFGYKSGVDLTPGQAAPSDGYLHGTFEASAIPPTATDLWSGNPGFLWGIQAGTSATHGGYFVPSCP